MLSVAKLYPAVAITDEDLIGWISNYVIDRTMWKRTRMQLGISVSIQCLQHVFNSCYNVAARYADSDSGDALRLLMQKKWRSIYLILSQHPPRMQG